MPACGHLAGLLLVNGDMGVRVEKEPDIQAAVVLAQKACDAGHPNACTILGSVYRKGKPVKKDHKVAKHYLERACDMGDYRGCAINGTMYELGWDGEKPNEERSRMLHQKAFELLQKLCAEKLLSCDTLAEYHADGFGTKQDPAKEVAVLRDACDRGHPSPCVLLGIKMEGGRGVSTDVQAAGELYRRGCEDGEGAGCYRLAYLHAKGNGFPKDEPRVTELISQSCDLGFMPSCIWLATKHRTGDGAPRDMKASLELRRRACSRSTKEACGQLALLLLGTDEHGLPRKEAEAEAIRTLTFGCDRVESGFECYQLAWMHDLGVGVPKNKTRARAMAQQGCDLGERAACDWVKDPAKGSRPVWVEFVKQTKK
jgi:TPR repeat protein